MLFYFDLGITDDMLDRVTVVLTAGKTASSVFR